MIYNFSAAWLWCLPILVGIVAMPLLAWRGWRLAYLAAWCGILWGGLAVELVRNWRGYENLRIYEITEDPAMRYTYGGGLQMFRSRIDVYGEMSREPYNEKYESPPTSVTRIARLFLDRDPWDPPAVDWWFHARNLSEKGSFTRTAVIVGFPFWFVSIVLLSPPAWWFFTRKRRLRAARARVDQCVNCGYSLQAHSAGQRCPECGILITKTT
jgi:hypothetical protein